MTTTALVAILAITPGLSSLQAASASASSGVATSSGPMKPKVALDLTVTTRTTIQVGSAVGFTGAAPTKLAGEAVTLQRREGKKAPWRKVGRATVADDGTFTLTGKAGRAGTNSWRASVTVDSRTSTQKYLSNAAKTTVYGWYFLTAKDWVDSDDESGSYPDTGPLTIAGKRYPRSVYFGSYTTSWDWERPAWAEYNLSYRCVTLKASLGIDDGSETGTNATFFVSVDGARSEVGSKGLGPATNVTVDVSNSMRIRLEGVPNSQNLYGHGGFGDVQVLCRKAP